MTEYTLPCDQTVPNSCGDTCNKLLNCGQHNCFERCHAGNCPPCVMMVNKSCRCGQSTKFMQCSKEFTCDKKCLRTRECGRHQCIFTFITWPYKLGKRRCCTGNCPECPEVCGKPLRCGNHKCPSPCHDGLSWFTCKVTLKGYVCLVH